MGAEGWKEWNSESMAIMLRTPEEEQATPGDDTVQDMPRAVGEAGWRGHHWRASSQGAA